MADSLPEKASGERWEGQAEVAEVAPEPMTIVFTDLDGTCVHYPGVHIYEQALQSGDDHGRQGSARVTLEVEPCLDTLDGARSKARLGLITAEVLFKVDECDGVLGARNGIHADNATSCSSDDSKGGRVPCKSTYELVALPESSSGSRGFISLETLELYKQMRAKGMVLVVISGCRYSTLLERLPFIPEADVYACESGGRIFYNEEGTLYEDLAWKASMRDQLEEMKRCKEAFRKDFREDLDEGRIKLDDRSYTTAFRVRQGTSAKKSTGTSCGSLSEATNFVERIQEWMGTRSGLSVTTNLGCVDIYPEHSGKKNAAAYIADTMGGWKLGTHAAFLCDDDNDIELVRCARKVFLPGMSKGLGEVVMNDLRNDAEAGREKYRFVHDARLRWYGNEPFAHTAYLLRALCKELDAQQEGNALVYCAVCGRLPTDCDHV